MGLNPGIIELGSQKALNRTKSMMAEALGMTLKEAEDQYSDKMSKETLSHLIGMYQYSGSTVALFITLHDDADDFSLHMYYCFPRKTVLNT